MDGPERNGSIIVAGQEVGLVQSTILGLVAEPRLGIDGKSFTINDEKTFLTFVSYFDYNDVPDANALADFQRLRDAGVRGIRLFPNWWTVKIQPPCPNEDCTPTYAADTLIRDDGTVREASYHNLNWYLAAAGSLGLVVDLSFSAENVAALCGTHDCHAPQTNLGCPADPDCQWAFLTLDEAARWDPRNCYTL